LFAGVLRQTFPDASTYRRPGVDHVAETYTQEGDLKMSTVTTENIAVPTMQLGGPRTVSSRRTAVLIGLLFLTATAAFILAEAINSGVLSQPDFLAGASSQTTMLATGALLLFGQFGVVGIAVLMFRC
jgi:hypothetical protein